ncbi:type III polyketide synthase [Bacillus sp. T33-2]|uniref:type III polyketide synthase n=1 Tax=Bacillus sp. T33-2 TaxID=2054168 RepID=UPI000C78411F|nr:3-oxoacyl-[acyl-carrier-protein] synthase III C-terminal domain-containing protein [Bacillus sp. T33-2]PLR99691.1 type III polyketide synthase [Bacillus sp. T33-2]
MEKVTVQKSEESRTMSTVISLAEAVPPYTFDQDLVMDFTEELFSDSFSDIKRLLSVFHNGQIKKRHFARDLDWFKKVRTLEEKNDAYIESAVELGAQAIKKCLSDEAFLLEPVPYDEIDAIFTISTTGLATPSIDARIMNILPFSPHTKRIPIWGLGCAGGASGLSRAHEYCLAYPDAKVLVLSIELCSLTFQKNDLSKSNLIGTSLFADGVACALLCGRDSGFEKLRRLPASPVILGTMSTTMPDSLDVMGWDIKNEGLYVIFSKSIPSIIENWLRPNVEEFLASHNMHINQIDHFIAHPGGKKVLDAYVKSLGIAPEMTDIPLAVLNDYGNMSSATIMYVLKRFLEKAGHGEIGLAAALGPGFSSELLLMRWE